jgi:hypothetical protein
MNKQELTPEECQALYLQALKELGKEPFNTKTVVVTSLEDFTNAVIKAHKEESIEC